MTAAGTIALLPLAMVQDGAPGRQVSISVMATPLAIDVKVATVMRPLDLAGLTAADFGDNDSIR